MKLSHSLQAPASKTVVFEGVRDDLKTYLLPVDAVIEASKPCRPEEEQKEVFAAINDVVAAAVFHGRSGCILAYGPSGE